MKKLTVYYRPSCAFSIGTLNFLFQRGADLRAVNLGEHEDEEARLRRRLDQDLETPVIEVDETLLVAPTMSELKEKLEAWGLPEQAAPYTRLKQADAA